MYPHLKINDNTYQFETKKGLVYRVSFSSAVIRFDVSCSLRDRVEEVYLDLITGIPIVFDSNISATVVDIIKNRCNEYGVAVVYICDDTDNKDRHRSIVFKRWNNTYNQDEYIFRSTVVEGEDMNLYAGIFVPINNPDATTFISQFDYTLNNTQGKF